MVYSPTFTIQILNVGEYTIHGSYGFKETLNGSRFFLARNGDPFLLGILNVLLLKIARCQLYLPSPRLNRPDRENWPGI